MNLRNEWYRQELKVGEESIVRRPLGRRVFFYRAVSSGNMDAVQKNCKSNTFISPERTGILSTNPLTNIKYHFVVTVAMITGCINEVMELEQAYRRITFTELPGILSGKMIIQKQPGRMTMLFLYNSLLLFTPALTKRLFILCYLS